MEPQSRDGDPKRQDCLMCFAQEETSMSTRFRSVSVFSCSALALFLISAKSAATADTDYVGSEVCVTCHTDQQKSFEHTVMGNAMMLHPKTSKEKLGCESCHGPGKAHVEAGGGKDTIPVRFTKDSKTPVEERNAACLSCHTKGNQMFWTGSPHESRAMACVDCHQVHYGSVAERYVEQANAPTKEQRYGQPLTD